MVLLIKVATPKLFLLSDSFDSAGCKEVMNRDSFGWANVPSPSPENWKVLRNSKFLDIVDSG